ncbi:MULTISPECIES: DUF2510 domain-containing protein [unclassified Streptomyces]|uniref:DUF2510 domain-containing protein n=1 Tax=unclassified Streptomyces TaxID=2593676 RepID=UPI00081E3E18|nr:MULTISPECIES: DUF2510 domain-containing protein [unclassified Streptomyces]MYR29181.1 DUF2510 domain-containing protein [Streptomyces sp. SID4945]SCD70576.1 Protein of unknown function [Streptomyces sp. TverLS-915]SCF44538.1 Protein of unknown function [Streptomyces sp. LcepLS]
METPPARPGWYPDPHGTHGERWWDGATWTPEVRAPGSSWFVPGGRGRPPGRAMFLALVLGGAVLLAGLVVGIAALSTRDDPLVRVTDSADGERGSTAPADRDGAGATLHGVVVPVPEGWRTEGRALVTGRPHRCRDDGGCTPGRITVTAVPGRPGAARARAERDNEAAAEAAYPGASHRLAAAGPVEAAGREGWLVRRRCEPREGAGGYVQSLVFPAPHEPGTLLVVRARLDADADPAGPAVLDETAEGIRAAN